MPILASRLRQVKETLMFHVNTLPGLKSAVYTALESRDIRSFKILSSGADRPSDPVRHARSDLLARTAPLLSEGYVHLQFEEAGEWRLRLDSLSRDGTARPPGTCSSGATGRRESSQGAAPELRPATGIKATRR